MGDVVLKCEHLHKNFGKKEILKDVSLELEKGDILGFIGPNGAGKTTTIKLILGLQSITSGTVKINGYDITSNFTNAIRNVGAIVENPDLYMYLTGYENLKLIANLYKGVGKERIDEVVKLVKLENRINDKVSRYSLGMRQRLGIAQAILHKPNLLILDEPTNGLDPEGIKEIRELLKDLAEKEEMAVLISSHNLLELETFCNKICIIKNGKVMETNKIEDVKNIAKSGYIFEIDNTEMIDKMFKNVTIVNRNMFKIAVDRDEVPSVIKKLVENDIKIYAVNENKISLEDAFLKKTGGNVID
ncbi:MAG: ABC transporter ATP-binding protein [Clostridia bacterium]|nr:ABC transporter ATP-binding protein [Clostridia bacterium]CDE83166.1 aBC transporter related [Clostridium sp. CAG:273]